MHMATCPSFGGPVVGDVSVFSQTLFVATCNRKRGIHLSAEATTYRCAKDEGSGFQLL